MGKWCFCTCLQMLNWNLLLLVCQKWPFQLAAVGPQSVRTRVPQKVWSHRPLLLCPVSLFFFFFNNRYMYVPLYIWRWYLSVCEKGEARCKFHVSICLCTWTCLHVVIGETVAVLVMTCSYKMVWIQVLYSHHDPSHPATKILFVWVACKSYSFAVTKCHTPSKISEFWSIEAKSLHLLRTIYFYVDIVWQELLPLLLLLHPRCGFI